MPSPPFCSLPILVLPLGRPLMEWHPSFFLLFYLKVKTSSFMTITFLLDVLPYLFKTNIKYILTRVQKLVNFPKYNLNDVRPVSEMF